MKVLISLLAQSYKVGFLTLILFGVVMGLSYENGWSHAFHLAFYAPTVGMLAIISGQLDLLYNIKEGQSVNIKARCIDFLHWLLLVFMNIGAWMVGGASISWFLLKIVLLGVIGASIGIGMQRLWKPSTTEKWVGLLAACAAMMLGILGGILRNSDSSYLGYGWATETITAIIGTIIVIVWISMDMRQIKKTASAYPRSTFLKGILSNTLVLWFWLHVMVQQGIGNISTWVSHTGLTFNILVGNILYIVYWLMYEYHIHAQKKNIEK